MSSEMNKSHPFRKSVSHEADASPAATPAPTPAPSPEAKIPSSSMSLLDKANAELANIERVKDEPCLDKKAGHSKKKAKMFGLGLLAMILWYGTLEVYDAIYATPSARSGAAIRASAAYGEPEDFENRDVDYARSQSGFFANLFCKGGKRSVFCD